MEDNELEFESEFCTDVDYRYVADIEKVQYQSQCILTDEDSPMRYQNGDGLITSGFYSVDPVLGFDELYDADYCVSEYIDDDEAMSDKENECEVLHWLKYDNFL